MGKLVGIDFGTTNSCMAVLDQGKPKVILDKERYKIIPSVVYFYKKNEETRIMVGRAAKSKFVENPFCTIHSIKRFLGKSFDMDEVKSAQERYFYIIDKDEKADSHQPNILIRVHEFDLSAPPVEIATYIFKYLKQVAENYLKEPVEDVVITMPTTFQTRYSAAIKQVAEGAGLNIVGLLNETTATAYAFGYINRGDHTIAVYDLGGGTFDFSILRRIPGGYEEIATLGESWLGGDDFDHAIVQYLIREFKNATRNRKFADGKVYKEGITITNKDVLRAVRAEAEKAKIALSETETTLIHVAKVIPEIDPTVDLNLKLSRDLLEYVVSDLVEKTITIALDTMENANTLVPKLKLDALLLVGGQSRMPKIKQRLREVFGDIIFDQILPEEAVAIGAAIYGNVLKAVEKRKAQAQA
jgi:molecular chaperone DnaK